MEAVFFNIKHERYRRRNYYSCDSDSVSVKTRP